ncbi:transcriptional regulator [Allokutzneria sp. A3M-2-11 16]|uniref:transcriptional regulator n=1 Tax=Allokutzneria sp. A3M-2-11 16 TaxID=2962043 RepID=UPI0020B83A98|nr:transcriptional regulator [Allokutzneria sp. A3M-2-11 16]MCP3800047.1 transcriptional regulator [Allokutzneria sp. A3M-2-11 16]
MSESSVAESSVAGSQVESAGSLVPRLTEAIRPLVRRTLDEPDIRKALVKGRVPPEDIEHKTARRTDELLRATNPEIAELREAERNLTDHQRPRALASRVAAKERRQYQRAQRSMGFAVWLAVAYPFAVWQLWPLVHPVIGGFFAVVVAIGCAIAVILKCDFSFERHGGKPADGLFVAVGFGVAVGHALMLVLLVGPTRATLGDSAAWMIWLPASLFALVIVFFSLEGLRQGLREHQQARGIFVSLATAAVLGVGTWFGLNRWEAVTLPWIPVASGLAVGLLVMVVFRPLVARRGTAWLPKWLSTDPRRLGSPSWRRRLAVLQDDEQTAYKRWERAMVDKAIRPLILRQVNDIVSPPFSTKLEVHDTKGLQHLRSTEFVVATGTFAEFRRVASSIGGGAVGIAGSRGAGKSTLLEAYRDGIFLGPGEEHVALVESVPVRYDARDFTLHLYAGLCREVLRFGRKHISSTTSWWRRLGRWMRDIAVVPIVLAGWLAVGYLGTTTLRAPELAVFREGFWWPLMAVLALASVIFLAVKRRPPATRIAMNTADVKSLRDLCACAEDKLDAIRYLQKHTSGWSGKVGLLFGAEGSRSGAVEFARQAMTYPEVVSDFRDFLTTAAEVLGTVPKIARIRIAIVLDELDKILSPESAQEFVNEVKALFSIDVPGCLFLVSVSEDALAAFERRGLPVRDAFDSAFDTIFRVDYLGLDDARALLRSRVLGMSEPFVCLCHSVSGGLPRELIRTARAVVASPKRSLAAVCQGLVAEDLAGKTAALRTVIARGLADEPHASELMRHIQLHAKPDAARLLEGASAPPIPDGDLWHLQLEALCYLYYAATLLEVFDDGLTESQLERGRNSETLGGFNTLASVRQLFGVNVRLAWLTVSDFRADWGLATVEPPRTKGKFGRDGEGATVASGS